MESVRSCEEVQAKQSIIRAFFDEPTNTVSYLVADPATKKAAIIDPVLDYDHNVGTTDTRSAEAKLKAATEAGFTIEWALESHAHADHRRRRVLLGQLAAS